MTPSDVEAGLAIEQASFIQPWSEEDLRYELLSNPCSRLYVVVVQGQIIAYADLWLMFEQAEVAKIAVEKNYRHQGYGQRLLTYLENKARKAHCETMSLEVRIDNQVAITLYEACGFVRMTIRKDYYTDHTDAYLMVKGI